MLTMVTAYGYGYGYGYGLYWDPTYILVVIGVIISLVASSRVRSAFNKYSKVKTVRGITGAEAAEQILRQQGIYDVRVEKVAGNLTDHYDPKSKTLRLSDTVYGSTSVAAVGVAAHECGHAIQHDTGYAPLSIRGAIVPVANFGSTISWVLIIIGLMMGGSSILVNVGILLFSAVVLFHLVTLPVEFNASSRALKILSESGILHGDENNGAKRVLQAAALTYVASAAAAILQLLRIVLLSRGRRRD